MRAREIEREQRVQAAQKQLEELKEQVRSGTTLTFENGRVTSRVPLSMATLKQIQKLSATISRNPLIAARKPKTRKTAATPRRPDVPADATLFTDQMLAARWHCSTSRLQYWRSHGQGLPYMKIHGRVLYRLEDITSYEQDALITPEVIPRRKSTSAATSSS